MSETESKTENKDYTESTRPGTVYQVFQHYNKAAYNECGEKYVCIKPNIEENKIKTKYLLNE